MPDGAGAERVAHMAAAARVPLDPGSAERIANATAGPAQRFAEANPAFPFETEPATFVVVARRDFER
jgi:hypothetical protein